MKNIFLLFALIIFSTISAQMPSSSESWNSTFQRYDIYNGSGTLIGYKKYNQTFNRWETFDLRTNNSSSSSNTSNYPKSTPRNRSVPDLEYPSISSSDIEYAKILARNRASNESSERKRIGNKNGSIVQNKYEELFAKIAGLDISELEKSDFQEKFVDKINIAHKTYPDVSNPELAKDKIRYIVENYNELLEKYVNNPNRKKKEIIEENAGKEEYEKRIKNLMKEGLRKEEVRDYIGAINVFESVLTNRLSESQESAVLSILYDLYLEIDNYSRAHFYNKSLHEKYPNSKKYFINEGKINYLQGNYDQSINYFNKVLLPYGESTATKSNIKSIVAYEDKTVDSKISLINLDTGFDWYFLRGKANLKLGKIAIACKDFQLTLKNLPYPPEEVKVLKNKYCQKK